VPNSWLLVALLAASATCCHGKLTMPPPLLLLSGIPEQLTCNSSQLTDDNHGAVPMTAELKQAMVAKVIGYPFQLPMCR